MTYVGDGRRRGGSRDAQSALSRHNGRPARPLGASVPGSLPSVIRRKPGMDLGPLPNQVRSARRFAPEDARCSRWGCLVRTHSSAWRSPW